MAGRNDPCPCGSGKKYKKCCERVVAIRSAQQVREERDSKIKSQLFQHLIQWFRKQSSGEIEQYWSERFKESLNLPSDQPIPPHFTFAYQFWLMLDAPCLDSLRPVEVWREKGSFSPDTRLWVDELCNIHLDCYKVEEEIRETVVLCSLSNGERYTVPQTKGISPGMFLVTRLSRLGSRHELFGPYTFFGVEMRGEIEVYIKNRSNEGELNREFWQNNGLQILGWMVQRANEIDQLEKITASRQANQELASTMEHPSAIPAEEKKNSLPRVPVLSSEQAGLPDVVEQQLAQFQSRYVSQFQLKTQELYRESLALFREYIAAHFGKSFTWSQLKEEVFLHFLGVWYVDQGVGGPIRAKIFLNTIKHFIRWVRDEAIGDVYPAFSRVYSELIHHLPQSFEARKWLQENGVAEEPEEPNLAAKGTYILAISAAGASLDTGETWIPVQLNTRSWPPAWMENRFWVRGTIYLKREESVMTDIESVYPFFQSKAVEIVS
ncbi:YecA family protein [Desmospora activa]|uniref:SEC-C motif-containing protein n=1 Tax=Desmospora activa DSM 45169 TaxID=1121389 RepID=A0A2T4ZBN5_9BACL|nr:SEC-C domain-containing protein [Desmospora activa]PTM59314.1 SEC-C motif-containing protein [Desmospora activa DSM 45169]